MRPAILAPLGAALFTVSWAVLSAVSPGYRLFDLVIEPYDPVSQPISGLGRGVTGPWMNTAFVVGGLLQVGRDDTAVTVVATAAILLASINIFGGFAVTRRMLAMFSRS